MTKIDFTKDKTQLEKAKFHLEFMMLMLHSNRPNDVLKSFAKALSIINEEIEKDSKNTESV